MRYVCHRDLTRRTSLISFSCVASEWWARYRPRDGQDVFGRGVWGWAYVPGTGQCLLFSSAVLIDFHKVFPAHLLRNRFHLHGSLSTVRRSSGHHQRRCQVRAEPPTHPIISNVVAFGSSEVGVAGTGTGGPGAPPGASEDVLPGVGAGIMSPAAQNGGGLSAGQLFDPNTGRKS